MAGMCFGVNIAETEATTPIEQSSDALRRRRMEIQQFRFAASEVKNGRKRLKMEKIGLESKRRKLETSVTISLTPLVANQMKLTERESESRALDLTESTSSVRIGGEVASDLPKFGTTSVCGRRRDMEDAVAIHPSFSKANDEESSNLHFFGVYDGHGCSHVAMKCKERMHDIVKSEVENGEAPWKEAMKRSFCQMDKEAVDSCYTGGSSSLGPSCRCELQTPQCDAVGSTAVVALLTSDKIVVSNCGDSRAVLCRNGVAIPLSVDHKPDRPDELNRIQEAGGRVIYWDGPRVLGVLAMSRAIGDNYLKPYVISEPEVTVTERSGEDECLILASDGLWDVVSNETACGVARMCLQSRRPTSPDGSSENDVSMSCAGGDATMAAKECIHDTGLAPLANWNLLFFESHYFPPHPAFVAAT